MLRLVCSGAPVSPGAASAASAVAAAERNLFSKSFTKLNASSQFELSSCPNMESTLDSMSQTDRQTDTDVYLGRDMTVEYFQHDDSIVLSIDSSDYE